MKTKTFRPAWWMLYVLLIGMLGLILLESQDGASTSAHEIIDGIIIIGFFGSLLVWIHFNESGLERAELEHASLSEFHVVEYEPTQSAYAPLDSTYAPKESAESPSRVEEGEYVLLPLRNN